MKHMKTKKLMAWTLSAALLITQFSVPVYAQTTIFEGNLCEHHTYHTPVCGYIDGTDCNHTIHDTACGFAEGTACNHIDNHDTACGFAVGAPCTFTKEQCELCVAKENVEQNALENVEQNALENSEQDALENVEQDALENVEQDILDKTCVCEALCTEELQNPECIACGADFSMCQYEQEAPEAVENIVVIAFGELETAVKEQVVPSGTTLDKLNLPSSLEANITPLDATTPAAISIEGVEWELDPENEINEGKSTYNPAEGSYSFTPILPEGYTLADDVALPEIWVMVGGVALMASNIIDTGDFSLTSDSPLTANTDYTYNDNTLTILTNNAVTISMKDGVALTSKDKIVVPTDNTNANITLNGVNIKFDDGSNNGGGTCAFELQGSAKVTLTLVGTSTLKSGSGKAGLQVQTKDGATAELIITAASTGSLNATGGSYDRNGRVYGGAGIGAGAQDVVGGGAGGTIAISGGTVTATSLYYGAGIGGGGIRYLGESYGAGGTITIRGGTIEATSTYGAGIGGGVGNSGGAGGNITISGGSVKTASITNAPVITTNVPVFLGKLNFENVTSVSVDSKPYYISENHKDDTNLYLYMTGADHTVHVKKSDGKVYTYNAAYANNSFTLAQVGNATIPSGESTVAFNSEGYKVTCGTATQDVIVTVTPAAKRIQSRVVAMNILSLTLTKKDDSNILWSASQAVSSSGNAFTVDTETLELGNYTLTAVYGGSATDKASTKTATLTVLSATPENHTITASAGTGGTISPNGITSLKRGDDKTFKIVANINYSISDVIVDGESKGAINSYTFEYVTTNHIISASFTANADGDGDGDSDSDSGGGGDSDSDSGGSINPPTPPPVGNPTPPTTSDVKPPVTVDGNGNATTKIPDDKVQEAIKKAVEQAQKNGTTANGIAISVMIDVKTTANSLTAGLSAGTLNRLIAAKVEYLSLTSGFVNLRFDLEALKQLQSQSNGEIAIKAVRQDVKKLSTAAQTAIGNRPAMEITTSWQNNGKVANITNFGKGSIAVGIPYTKTATEQTGYLYGVYVDSKGAVTYITNSSFDTGSKMLILTTNHLSVYGVGYKALTTVFTDIANHWAKNDIDFVAARGLLSGTGKTTFSPDTSMTRGMFVTALGRLAGVDTKKFENTKFTDVKADAYYSPYVAWANVNNIVNGTTATTFSPDQSITRQEMAVMLVNYSKAIGYKLPSVHAQVTFADSASIGTWAADAVKQMQMAGILTGKSGNKFDPTATATRAEVSAMLRRYVELLVSSETAEGWAMNESGQWMYIQDGKRVTGKKTVDGKAYEFDQYGVTTALLPERKYGVHTVQKGESFWSIAWKYKVSMFELTAVNGKSIFSIIYAGDELKIPQK